MKTRTNQPVTTYDLEELEVSGNAKLFENIVDKDGHARFIEGDITPETISGVSTPYAKWSLSGSHLLIVLCESIADGTTAQFKHASLTLPNWVLDKLVPIYSDIVARMAMTYYGSDGTAQSATSYLTKTDTGLTIYISAVTLTADRTGRLQFDLLVDNE